MSPANLAGVFLLLCRLRATLRAGWVHRGSNYPQTTADHTLELVGGVLFNGYFSPLKPQTVLLDAIMAIVHDLDEYGLHLDETPYKSEDLGDDPSGFFADATWVKPEFVRGGRGGMRRFRVRLAKVRALLESHQLSGEVADLVVRFWSEYNRPGESTHRAARVRNLHLLADAAEAVAERELTPKMHSTDSFLAQAISGAKGLEEAVAIIVAEHGKLQSVQ